MSIPSAHLRATAYQSPGGKEFIRFVSIVYGSLLELETQGELALRLALLAKDDADALLRRTAELGRILNGLRRSLRAALEHQTDPRIRESEAAYVRHPH